MDIDLIIPEIDLQHKIAKQAFTIKDLNNYTNIFNDNLKYTQFDGEILDKNHFIDYLEKYFKHNNAIALDYYRIKSNIEEDYFIEKMAKKVVSKQQHLLLLKKKQTSQTEETIKWQKINGIWQVSEVQITLEEIY